MATSKKKQKQEDKLTVSSLVKAFIEGRKSLRYFTSTEAAVQHFTEGAVKVILESEEEELNVPQIDKEDQ